MRRIKSIMGFNIFRMVDIDNAWSCLFANLKQD